MKRRSWATASVVATVVWSALAGCAPESSDSGDAGSHPHAGSDADPHRGDEGDGHADAPVGPHGGHLVRLGDGEYHGEWLHDDKTHTVTVILLDDQGEAEVAVPASEVRIDIAVGERHQSYALSAVNATDEDIPKASRFETVSDELLVHLNVGAGVTATLTVDVDGKLYMGRIEHHEHDDHDHHHH